MKQQKNSLVLVLNTKENGTKTAVSIFDLFVTKEKVFCSYNSIQLHRSIQFNAATSQSNHSCYYKLYLCSRPAFARTICQRLVPLSTHLKGRIGYTYFQMLARTECILQVDIFCRNILNAKVVRNSMSAHGKHLSRFLPTRLEV